MCTFILTFCNTKIKKTDIKKRTTSTPSPHPKKNMKKCYGVSELIY